MLLWVDAIRVLTRVSPRPFVNLVPCHPKWIVVFCKMEVSCNLLDVDPCNWRKLVFCQAVWSGVFTPPRLLPCALPTSGWTTWLKSSHGGWKCSLGYRVNSFVRSCIVPGIIGVWTLHVFGSRCCWEEDFALCTLDAETVSGAVCFQPHPKCFKTLGSRPVNHHVMNQVTVTLVPAHVIYLFMLFIILPFVVSGGK